MPDTDKKKTAPPRFPVPVVRLVILDKQGRVLVLRRANTAYGQGQWCLPGGKVDYNKTVEQAVIDELREETSLSCAEMHFLFYQDSLPPEEGGMHCLNLYFECRPSGQIELNPESSDSAWVSEQELDKYALVFRNDEGLRRYWQLKRAHS